MPTTLPSDFIELLAAFAAAGVEYLLVEHRLQLLNIATHELEPVIPGPCG